MAALKPCPPVAVFTLEQIQKELPPPHALLSLLADSFVLFSQGQVVLAPPSHLSFAAAGINADCCVKFAYAVGGALWVGKVAAGFYDNPAAGLPSSCGLMLLFDQKLGVPRGILLERGFLTDLRTAYAAALTARALAPRAARAVGLIGAGTIARLLLDVLPLATQCRALVVWARREAAAEELCALARRAGWEAAAAASPARVLAECDLVFTCTPSRAPLLTAADLRARGEGHALHLCALGADAEGKQELEPALVARAELLVADSKAQCLAFGELSHALRAKLVREDDARLIELGELLSSRVALQRGDHTDTRFTLADSTGIGASDLAIAQAVYANLVNFELPSGPPRHQWRNSLQATGAKL
ncbi:hypothetical protein AB1Y20_006622 [Prymnesium parvum]|uniref:Ornithine cyclodeaminase n=1 Tax=Prymnesium parvum TaxID=97485 RepID=A0AB34IYM0_PRYPA